MKLRNKKTGEVGELLVGTEGMTVKTKDDFDIGYNLKTLAEEWEDYEEPTGYWYIDFDGEVLGCAEGFDEETEERRNEIGNYFETREEAEKAVEKLKAWKRLKDKGLKFVGWEDTNNDVNDILFELPYMEWDKNVSDDLDSLFGGEK